MKKILSLFLAFTICLGLVPTAAFAAQNDFEIENGVLVKYIGKGGDVTIPDGVTAIGRRAFDNCTTLTSVIIPDSVTEIGEEAFWNCCSLTSLAIPDGVVTIDSFAFNYCSGLTSITLPDSLTTIGQSAFKCCSGLIDVVIPDGVTTLGEGAFRECSNLVSVTIGNGVTQIGSSVFYYCASLKNVTIGNSVTAIGDLAFAQCPSLTQIEIPDSVMDLGSSTFWACSDLTSVTIGAGITVIGFNVFNECTSLTSIHIPAGVTEIEFRAFADCTALTEVIIDNPDVKIDSYTFGNCTNLKSYTKGNQIVELGENGTQKSDNSNTATSANTVEQTKEEKAQAEWEKKSKYAKKNYLERNLEFLSNGIEAKYYENTIVTPEIQAVSDKICAKLNTNEEKVRAIHDWVTENIYYDYVAYYSGTYTWHTAQEMLDDRKGVCSNYAVLLQALCWAQDIPCVYVTGKTTGGGHAWNVVWLDGEWKWIDSTWDTFNAYRGNNRWIEGDRGLVYYLCPTEFFSTNHCAEQALIINGINANAPEQTETVVEQIIQEETEKLLDKSYLESLSEEAKSDTTLSGWAKAEVANAILANLVPREIMGIYNGDITREEFCALMIRLVEQKSGQNIESYTFAKGVSYNLPFTDTRNSTIGFAYALGIVNGTSDTTFNPDGSITRQEAAAMLTRTAKVLGLTAGAGETFNDTAQIADWAKEGVSFVSALKDPTTGNKVMGGTGDGNFSPLDTYTREQAILTALRLFHCE